MKRRHFFDRGFAASTPALVAGSAVLLAVSRQSLQASKTRLSMSSLLLAEAVARVVHGKKRCIYAVRRRVARSPSR